MVRLDVIVVVEWVVHVVVTVCLTGLYMGSADT
jgi:hypothetical protein